MSQHRSFGGTEAPNVSTKASHYQRLREAADKAIADFLLAKDAADAKKIIADSAQAVATSAYNQLSDMVNANELKEAQVVVQAQPAPVEGE